MGLTKGQLRRLKPLLPYLIGDRPGDNNEWPMYCPFHGVNGKAELSRSASLNTELMKWFCFAGCGGGDVEDLLERQDIWVEPPSAAARAAAGGRSRSGSSNSQELITDAHASGWHSSLMSNDERIDYLVRRGVTEEVLSRFEIGWDSERRVYTLPVRSPEGELWNIRRYNPNPRPGAPKMYSVTGMGSPRIYPIEMLDAEEIIICEGEWDTLATIARGYAAVTRTGAADVWRSEWSPLFKGKVVYLAHDADHKGQTANRKVGRALKSVADVRVVKLPYEVVPKHGKDLTDYWLEGHSGEEFDHLLANAEKNGTASETASREKPELISVVDSYDAKNVGKPVQMSLTVNGIKEPGHSIPRKVKLECTQDKGNICSVCPLNSAGGEAEVSVMPNDPDILKMIETTEAIRNKVIATAYEIPGGKCPRLKFNVTEFQPIETLLARQSLDSIEAGRTESYKNITLTAVGKYGTSPNETMLVTGSLHPNPKTQRNDFLAWSLEQTETSLDHFDLTPEVIEMMKIFQSHAPLKKMKHIAKDLATHVTHITGRPEMHVLMDLTFHSVLAYNFDGRLERRGWLDTLIIGDTRTGKSEAAAALSRHYGVGEIIGGEMASVAGIVGGVVQIGTQWMVNWGVITINDRRLVVIDEASGMTHDDIAALSDVRASGLAKITKIRSEKAHARTRLLWLSNPRNARMHDYTYGVDGIQPLIGNNEDVARFDLAMSVQQGDVPSEIINRPHPGGHLTYSAAACHALILWAWTRQPDQIVWSDDAEDAVLRAANAMGKRYVDDPPLVQAANIRTKIARTAAALAARTFSTDSSCELLLITPRHVKDAVVFMDRLYSMGTFGYADRSEERISDRKEAERNIDATRRYLSHMPGLTKFLGGQRHFRRQDLEEILDISKDQANSIINNLWDYRMVRKEQANVVIEPTLHRILREG